MTAATEINYVRRGSGTPLVLIHGIGSRLQMWDPVFDLLAAHHEVIALDLPGFGQTPPPPPGTTPGTTTQCDQLLEFFAAIGIERPHVAGNSMGGQIVLELAKRGDVASAVALSPAGFHNQAERIFQIASLLMMRNMCRYGGPAARLPLQSATGRRLVLRNVVAHPERMTAEQAIGDVDGMAAATWLEPNLWWFASHPFTSGAEIQVPVTIAWGDKDGLLLPRQAPRALREIPSAFFVNLHDCGHVPTYDNPELVTRVILEGSRSA
jgi:pimeloyl-ACP methyl ester carboxylesterase